MSGSPQRAREPRGVAAPLAAAVTELLNLARCHFGSGRLTACRLPTAESGPQGAWSRSIPRLCSRTRRVSPPPHESRQLPCSDLDLFTGQGIADIFSLRLAFYPRSAPRFCFSAHNPVGIFMQCIRRLTAIFAVVAATCIIMSSFGCGAPPPDGPDAESAARVDALLPTAEPVAPAVARAYTAVSPTNDPAAPINTPVPPTYTPRPLPTYTPRPVPIPAGEGERTQAIPFQAQSLDGAEVNLPDTFGTPTLLAFWAPW